MPDTKPYKATRKDAFVIAVANWWLRTFLSVKALVETGHLHTCTDPAACACAAHLFCLAAYGVGYAQAMRDRDHMTGVGLIAAERQRQVSAEGWTTQHDAEHWKDDLAMAAVCYATPPARRKPEFVNQRAMRPDGWPWELHFWKPTPSDRVRELVKAGALIAAEIDRLQASDG